MNFTVTLFISLKYSFEMFGNDKSIDNLQQLFVEIKKYIDLQKEYYTFDLVEKLTTILSAMALLAVLLVLGLIALFYLSFTLIYILAPYVGGLSVSYAIVTCLILILMLIIYINRKRWVVKPLVNFLTDLFLKK